VNSAHSREGQPKQITAAKVRFSLALKLVALRASIVPEVCNCDMLRDMYWIISRRPQKIQNTLQK
jgi:hypothetical protein